MLGRQEFADGPRQLMSVSDGPNLHRTWNGVRLYAHGRRARAGAFGFCATRLGEHGFDERIDCDECLRGANASFVLTAVERERSTFFDPFWFHSSSPASRCRARWPTTGATRSERDCGAALEASVSTSRSRGKWGNTASTT